MNGPCALVPLVVLLTILILDDLTSLSTSFSFSSTHLSQTIQDGVNYPFRTTGRLEDFVTLRRQSHRHERDHGRQLRWSHGYGFGARASPLHHPQHFLTSEDDQFVSENENITVSSSITQSRSQSVPHARSQSQPLGNPDRDNVPIHEDNDLSRQAQISRNQGQPRTQSQTESRNQSQSQSRQQWRASHNNSISGQIDNEEFDDDDNGRLDSNEFGGGTKVPMGWVDPRLRGGRMLDFTLPRRGEPLNVIISGLSDPYILTPRGLLHYAQSLGFSSECLGFHIGQLHVANLGDSHLIGSPSPSPPRRSPRDRSSTSSSSSSTSTSTSTLAPSTLPLSTPSVTANATLTTPNHDTLPGFPQDSDDDDDDDDDISHPPMDDIPDAPSGGNKTEQLLARQNFDWPMHGWPDYGTCLESLIGGNHFRAWKQDGAGARTGAWFLAVSRELWAGRHHDIAPDGYNKGREQLVARALLPTRWSPTLDGIWWKSEVIYNTTLLKPGRDGINHGIAQDGKVAIITVRRRDKPPSIGELERAWNPFLNAYQGPSSPNSDSNSNSSWFGRLSWLNVFSRIRRWWKTDDEERALRRRAMWELQEVLKIRQAELADRARARARHRTSWLDWIGVLYKTWLSNQ